MKVEELIDKTSELCDRVAQLMEATGELMLRSEERTMKMNEVFEKQTHCLSLIAKENEEQRKRIDRQAATILRDREQLRDEYKALVLQCLKDNESQRREAERMRDVLKMMIERIAPTTMINNR